MYTIQNITKFECYLNKLFLLLLAQINCSAFRSERLLRLLSIPPPPTELTLSEEQFVA